MIDYLMVSKTYCFLVKEISIEECVPQHRFGRLVIPMKPQKKKIDKFDDVQKKWLLMKEIWLKGSKQVCGMTKGRPRHKETWWWNRDGRGVCQTKGMSQSMAKI